MIRLKRDFYLGKDAVTIIKKVIHDKWSLDVNRVVKSLVQVASLQIDKKNLSVANNQKQEIAKLG